jgi:hypothetical protein
MPLLADAQANIFCEVDLPIPFATTRFSSHA